MNADDRVVVDKSWRSTVRLADLSGLGRDALIGRSGTGVRVYRFDAARDRWSRPEDGEGVPELLADLVSFAPWN